MFFLDRFFRANQTPALIEDARTRTTQPIRSTFWQKPNLHSCGDFGVRPKSHRQPLRHCSRWPLLMMSTAHQSTQTRWHPPCRASASLAKTFGVSDANPMPGVSQNGAGGAPGDIDGQAGGRARGSARVKRPTKSGQMPNQSPTSPP
jgi:hypothetical protein